MEHYTHTDQTNRLLQVNVVTKHTITYLQFQFKAALQPIMPLSRLKYLSFCGFFNLNL